MSALQDKTSPELSFEYHVNAAKFCNKAAMEHSHAAQCCANGNEVKARGHAQNAYTYSKIAEDLGRQAIHEEVQGLWAQP